MQTIRQLAANLNDAFVPPKRGRGRPSKPTDKTPCCVPFKDVAAATKGIPPDESGKPGRNQAKERARKIIAEDGRILGRAPLAISNVLLDDMRWNKGLISHSLNHLAKVTKVHLSTVKRVLNLLEDCGHIRRKPKAERRLTAKGDDDINEFVLPVLVTAWSQLSDGVGANNSGGWAQENPEPDGGWARGCAQGRRTGAPHPSDDSSESSCCGSAHARASTEEAVQSFLSGEDLAKPEVLKPQAPDWLTEKQLATFRDLADTFGMRPGQMVLNPIQRADSDRMLIDLVTSTLSGFPADVVRRAVEASLLKAEAQRLSDLQDGSAGKRRGGIGRLSGYLLSLLRPVANDLMRQEDANEARNRSEKEVHKRRHATHLSSVQARSGRSAQHSMAEAVRAAFAAPNTGGET